ncbi:hypothetical protein B0T22DRAFT_267254 [Podospora appendiculata]|uniref:Uncharacterized protein n=1 Tax=Podospora appendiculata TaxID=314037 RepID=A0AAE0X3D4_9PEZI|nr:hypothetical protein B0T22DRAFT_267254 [Podospora appendiculata]
MPCQGSFRTSSRLQNPLKVGVSPCAWVQTDVGAFQSALPAASVKLNRSFPFASPITACQRDLSSVTHRADSFQIQLALHVSLSSTRGGQGRMEARHCRPNQPGHCMTFIAQLAWSGCVLCARTQNSQKTQPPTHLSPPVRRMGGQHRIDCRWSRITDHGRRMSRAQRLHLSLHCPSISYGLCRATIEQPRQTYTPGTTEEMNKKALPSLYYVHEEHIWKEKRGIPKALINNIVTQG